MNTQYLKMQFVASFVWSDEKAVEFYMQLNLSGYQLKLCSYNFKLLYVIPHGNHKENIYRMHTKKIIRESKYLTTESINTKTG